jgi:hypothetical protein
LRMSKIYISSASVHIHSDARTYVAVVIFVSDGEVVRFHGVPGDAVRGKVEDCPVERRACAHIIQDDSTICSAGCQDGRLDLVEADVVDGVDG